MKNLDVNIPIGRNIIRKGSITNLEIKKFGVNFIIAKSRSGKSTIIKNMLCRMYEAHYHRKLVIFDPYSEYGDIKFPNFDLKNNDFIGSYPNIKTIKNFGFKIEDFSIDDFISLGITSLGSQIMYRIIQAKFIHHNDFEFIENMLSELPRTDAEVKKWNNQYQDLNLKSKIHTQIYDSINTRFYLLKDYFYTEDSNLNYYNFKEEVRHYNLHIDFGIETPSKKQAYPLLAGIILRQLKSLNIELSPIYIFDEIDILCPNSDFITPVHDFIKGFIFKEMRNNIVIFGITQHPDLPDPDLVRGFHNIILGKLNNASGYFGEITKGLKWDLVTGQRQFLILKMNNYYEVFEPYYPAYSQ